MTKVHRSEFLKEVKVHFPEIRQEINQQDGLLGFEIDCFRRFTQTLIDAGNRERVLRHINWLNGLIRTEIRH